MEMDLFSLLLSVSYPACRQLFTLILQIGKWWINCETTVFLRSIRELSSQSKVLILKDGERDWHIHRIQVSWSTHAKVKLLPCSIRIVKLINRVWSSVYPHCGLQWEVKSPVVPITVGQHIIFCEFHLQ